MVIRLWFYQNRCHFEGSDIFVISVTFSMMVFEKLSLKLVIDGSFGMTHHYKFEVIWLFWDVVFWSLYMVVLEWN